MLLDGHKIKDLNVKWLRSSMKLVQQEPGELDEESLSTWVFANK